MYFARTTSDQAGGIASVHLFGPGVFEKVISFFRPKSGKSPLTQPHRLYYGHVVDGEEVIDEAVLHFIDAQDEQGVGQPLVEVNVHGSQAVVRRLSRLLRQRGFREVHENALVELSFRAGYLSFIQKEAYFALKRVRTLKGSLLLNRYYQGKGFEELRRGVDSFLSGKLHSGKETRYSLLQCVDRSIENYPFLRWLIHPPEVMIVGPPNVGKSTLLNTLLGFERVVTSPEMGTTRDVIGAHLMLDGFLVRLYDSPGILDTAKENDSPFSEINRENTPPLWGKNSLREWKTPSSRKENGGSLPPRDGEREKEERTLNEQAMGAAVRAMGRQDILIVVHDGQIPISEGFRKWLGRLRERHSRLRLLWVQNKVDQEKLYSTKMSFKSGEAPHSAYGGSLTNPCGSGHPPKRGREIAGRLVHKRERDEVSLPVSALYQKGIKELKEILAETLGITPGWEKEREGFFTPRQKIIGERLREAIIKKDRVTVSHFYDQLFRGSLPHASLEASARPGVQSV